MLTRSDSWEPIERPPFIHLRGRPRTGRVPPRASGRKSPLEPAPVERVIRQICGQPGG